MAIACQIVVKYVSSFRSIVGNDIADRPEGFRAVGRRCYLNPILAGAIRGFSDFSSA